jgi:pimeloyl-ACP methyl ester carboxylesterase
MNSCSLQVCNALAAETLSSVQLRSLIISAMQRLQLRDGRTLGYSCYGTPQGRPVLYFHGLPGSRREARLLDEPARTLNVRVIAPDRPGYGFSTLQPARQLLDWPQDVFELAEALDIGRFGLLGVSGGGPYVLACARAIPQRIASVGVVCGLAPVTDRTPRESMRWLPRSAFFLAANRPWLLDVLYGWPATWLVRTVPTFLLRVLAHFNGEPDKSVMLRPDVLNTLAQNISESFCQGPRGVEHDLEILSGTWGFQLQDIEKFVYLWHGDMDSVVPKCHSEYVHSQLPRAQLSVVAGEAHFSLPIRHRANILTSILEAGGW